VTEEEVLDLATEICKEFEGFKANEYICPAGIKTIGYGTTRNYSTNTITKEEAIELLKRDLKENLNYVKLYAPNLADHKLAAILSWVYNLGVGNFKSSTMLKRIQEGDHEEAAKEMLRWNKANGKPLKGLTRRRKREHDIYLGIL